MTDRQADLSTPVPQAANPSPARPGWALVLIVLIWLGLLGGWERIWSPEIFGHLAAGQRILDSGDIAGADQWLSGTERPWVNRSWMFDATIAWLHGKPGYWPCLMWGLGKMLILGGMTALMACMLRPRSSPAAMGVCVAAAVVAVQAQLNLRPGLPALGLLAVTLWSLESVRTSGRARRLAWTGIALALWVNIDQSFLLGLSLLWLAEAGAWLDRLTRRRLAHGLANWRTLAWAVGISAAVVFANPWPGRHIASGLRPWVDGTTRLYAQLGLVEYTPSWQAAGHLGVLVAAGLVALAAVAMLVRLRRVPLAHVLWLGVLALVGLSAVRNLIFPAVGAAMLAAMHLSALGGAAAGRVGVLRRLALPAAIVVSAAAFIGAMLYPLGLVHRFRGVVARPGFDALEDHFALGMGAQISSASAPGDVLCLHLGHAGALEWSANLNATTPTPPHRLFADWRAELNSPDRLAEIARIRGEIALGPSSAREVRLPEGTHYVVLDAGQPELIANLHASGRFKTVFIDRNAVCLAPLDAPGSPVAELNVNLWAYDKPLAVEPLEPILTPETLHVYARRWYRNNPPRGHLRVGIELVSLGEELLGLRMLAASEAMGFAPPLERRRWLARANADWAEQNAFAASRALPANVFAARALWLFARPGACDLRCQDGRAAALRRVQLMIDTNLLDAASETLASIERDWPIAAAARTGVELLDLRRRLSERLWAAGQPAPSRADEHPGEFARRQAAAGRVLAAIASLEAIGEADAQSLTALGDLRLTLGEIDGARAAYAEAGQANAPGPQPFFPHELDMRRALCAWCEGQLAQTKLILAEIEPAARIDLAVHYYWAALLEMLGDYAGAAQAMQLYKPLTADVADRPAPVQDVQPLLRRLRARGHRVNLR